MVKAKWTHKVVKMMRGLQGEYFDFPTAGTFPSESAAREYAAAWARESLSPGAVAKVVRRGARRLSDGTVAAVPGGWYRSER